MKLLIGLGNPGIKYKGTRHNAGIILVDYLANINIQGFNLLASNSHMNSSGDFVKKFANDDLDDIYIAHDDLDIKLGNFKIKKSRGPHDHNGILSIERELNSKDFWRIRIGIDMRGENKEKGEKYVLEKFTQGELKILNSTFAEIANELKKI